MNIKYRILFLVKNILSTSILSLGKNEEFLIKGGSESSGNFEEIFSLPSFPELERKLFKHLDAKSKAVVSLILKRVRKFLNNNQTSFLNSYDEISRLNRAYEQKRLSLKKESDGFSYGKYLLSRAHFNNEIFFDKYFIEEFSQKTLQKNIKNKNIIDVGGFIGDTAVVFSDYTNKNVYVFEPVESNYNDLLKTIQLNQSEKILPFKTALGSEKKECVINIYEPTGVGSTIREDICASSVLKKEKIDVIPLDDFVERENLEVGLIKVDIEGAEQDFLKGAINTIKAQKPALLIAIYHSGYDFFSIKSQIDDLNLGYKFKIRKAAKNRLIEDTVLIAEACDD